MTTDTIRQAIKAAEKHFQGQTGPMPDICATAVVEDGLRCCIQSPDGKSVYTDMPEAVGGSSSANSPGWLLRAAIASCDATLLAMRAARQGIELESIKVKVDAMSDGRGMLLDEGISPGSSEIRVQFDVRASNASREDIQALVDWVIAHAPVSKDITQAVNVIFELQTD